MADLAKDIEQLIEDVFCTHSSPADAPPPAGLLLAAVRERRKSSYQDPILQRAAEACLVEKIQAMILPKWIQERETLLAFHKIEGSSDPRYHAVMEVMDASNAYLAYFLQKHSEVTALTVTQLLRWDAAINALYEELKVDVDIQEAQMSSDMTFSEVSMKILTTDNRAILWKLDT